jgi:hypothetical protein
MHRFNFGRKYGQGVVDTARAAGAGRLLNLLFPIFRTFRLPDLTLVNPQHRVAGIMLILLPLFVGIIQHPLAIYNKLVQALARFKADADSPHITLVGKGIAILGPVVKVAG